MNRSRPSLREQPPASFDILSAVPVHVAIERTGLDFDVLVLLVLLEEPDAPDGVGDMRPLIRSYPSDDGLLVSLEDAMEIAPAIRAITAEGGGR